MPKHDLLIETPIKRVFINQNAGIQLYKMLK
jgi:hypothetical protein